MLILFSTSHPSKGTSVVSVNDEGSAKLVALGMDDKRSAKLVNCRIPLGMVPVIGAGNGSGVPSGNSSVAADATINKVAPIVEKHFIIIIFKFL